MQGLTSETEKIFDAVANLNCIKNYTLIGGTALAIQTGNRLSEDLDFCQWHKNKSEKLEVDWYKIQEELKTIGEVNTNVLQKHQCDFTVNGVKVTFLADNRLKEPPGFTTKHIKGNIYAADEKSIGIMKLEVMLRRSVFRDYYDVYSILKEGGDFKEIVDGALKYSKHQLKSKDVVSMLTSGENFVKDANFDGLKPKYGVDNKQIEEFITPLAKEYFESLKKKITRSEALNNHIKNSSSTQTETKNIKKDNTPKI